MTPLAVITMVYDDEVFLRIWLSYWTKLLPRTNLYVLIHGDYELYEEIAKGCNTIRIHRPAAQAQSEVQRWDMLAKIASGLSVMFSKVIYTDVDEIIALDPDAGDDLINHILNLNAPIVAPFGFDVVDPTDLSLPKIDLEQGILQQRPYISSNAHYSKPCIISKPIRWGSGGHYCDEENVVLSNDLYLFHLRLFDEAIYSERSLKRNAMIKNESGELIEGYGGPTWRRNDDLARYSIETPEPITDFGFKRDRKMWMEDVKFEDGLWVRKGRQRKKLHHLPERMLSLF